MSRLGKSLPAILFRRRQSERSIDVGDGLLVAEYLPTVRESRPNFSKERRNKNRLRRQAQQRGRNKHGRIGISR